MNHPATDVNIKNDVKPLDEALRQSVPSATFEVAFERGAALHLEAIDDRLIGTG